MFDCAHAHDLDAERIEEYDVLLMYCLDNSLTTLRCVNGEEGFKLLYTASRSPMALSKDQVPVIDFDSAIPLSASSN